MNIVWVIVVCHQYIFVSFAGRDWKPSCLVRVNFPVKYTVLRKTRLVPSDCADGVNWSGCDSGPGSDYVWSSFFCVDWRSFRCCWIFTRMVACVLFKYFITRSDDKPGQEMKICFNCLYPPILSADSAWCVAIIHKCAFWFAFMHTPRKIKRHTCGLSPHIMLNPHSMWLGKNN